MTDGAADASYDPQRMAINAVSIVWATFANIKNPAKTAIRSTPLQG